MKKTEPKREHKQYTPSHNKIILILWRDKPGGIEVLLPDIIKNCNDITFEVFVLRKKVKIEISVFDNTTINVTYGADSNIRLFCKLYAYAKKNRNHVFHMFNAGPIVLLILRLASVKKMIYSIHGTIYWKTLWKKAFFKLIWLTAIKKSIKFTANSEYSKSVFLNTVKNSVPIQVIYNPINIQRFHPINKNIYEYNLNINYIGRLSPGKNLFRWLKAAERIHQSYPQAQFSIFGDGILHTKITAYIQKNRLNHYIKLKGHIKNIQKAYQEADFLLFLSSRESFGNVAVESILCGTPVIVSDIPSMREIFANFPEFLVPLDDNLEKNVIKKIGELPKLKKSATKATKEFKSRFSLDQHIQKIKRIYNSY